MATDVAARGLDVCDIRTVVNYARAPCRCPDPPSIGGAAGDNTTNRNGGPQIGSTVRNKMTEAPSRSRRRGGGDPTDQRPLCVSPWSPPVLAVMHPLSHITCTFHRAVFHSTSVSHTVITEQQVPG